MVQSMLVPMRNTSIHEVPGVVLLQLPPVLLDLLAEVSPHLVEALPEPGVTSQGGQHVLHPGKQQGGRGDRGGEAELQVS